jgi:hypothetical protein
VARLQVGRVLTSGSVSNPAAVFLEECAAAKLSLHCKPSQRYFMTVAERTWVRRDGALRATDAQWATFNRIRHSIRFKERMGAHAKAQEPQE